MEPANKVWRWARLKYWIPAVVAAALISIFSTRYFTPDETGRVIVPILRWFLPHASSTLIRHLHFGIRKLAHVMEFGVFSITVFRALRGPRAGWRLNWAVLTFLVAVSYSVVDEFHQTHVPLRHGSAKDIAIDGLGAVLAQLIVWWYAKGKWPHLRFGKNQKLLKGQDRCHF
jgi:VanZ family protein